MATLLPTGKQSFDDAGGLPLVGGKVYTYAAGTDTPKATWQDAAQTGANPNPVILDARGEATIFWNGAYKVKLTDAQDNIIWTLDNIATFDPVATALDEYMTLLASAAGAGEIGVTSGRTLQEELDVRAPYVTIAAIAGGGPYTLGQVLSSSLYGGSIWIVRANPIILQNNFPPQPLDSSKIDFTDELHVVVNLVGGGTGIAECQLGSIQGYITNQYTQLYNQVITRLRRAGVISANIGPVPGPAAQIACFGDSITFGQVPTGYPGYQPKIGVPTGFGDGSVYQFDQIASPYPSIMKGLCDIVFGQDKVTTQNLGYSGDRVGNAYRRHRFSSIGQTVSMVWYGTNDALYGSNNGIEPTKLFVNTEGYEYARFVNAYRKFVYREVLRGSMPICITPFAFKSLLGYDNTTWAAAKIAQHYRTAVMSVAAEINAGVVDAVDILNAYAQDTVTQGDPHLTFNGCYAVAARIMPMLMGNGFRDPTVISGTRKLMPIPHLENINGKGAGATDLTFVDNTASLGKSFTTTGTGADLLIDASANRYFTFYLEEDEIAAMPVVQLPVGSALTVQLDFNALQTQAKLNTRRGAMPGTYINLPISVGIDNTQGSVTKVVNHPGTSGIPTHLVIQGKGWHTLQLTALNTVVVSGMLFGRFGEMGVAIADPTGGATVDAQARTAITAILNTLRDQNIIRT